MKRRLAITRAYSMGLAAATTLVACGHARPTEFPDAAKQSTESAPPIACRIEASMSPRAHALAMELDHPRSLAGMVASVVLLSDAAREAGAALPAPGSAEADAYRKALTRLQGELDEVRTATEHVPPAVLAEAKRVSISNEAARTFAKGRSDGVDIVVKAAEADLGSRQWDSARLTEVASRLEVAAKMRTGVAPVITYASALRSLAKAADEWAGLTKLRGLSASVDAFAAAGNALAFTCGKSAKVTFSGTPSARPEDLRKRAIIISNVPAPSCVESARKLFPNIPEDGMGGHGTGFVVMRQGEPLIVTNRHVVSGAAMLLATRADGTKLPKVRLTYVSREHDIAILAFEEDARASFEAVPIADEDPPELAPVIAAGFPGLFGRASFQLTRGTVSNAKLLLPDGARDVVFLQHTAVVDPGSSGGPLVNEHGELVGINTRKALDREAVSFAIPASIVRNVVSEASEGFGRPGARAACLLGVDALQAGPAVFDAVSSHDLRTKQTASKEQVLEAVHHGTAAPCEVLKRGAVEAEFGELAKAGAPSPFEMCDGLETKGTDARVTLALPRGTATLALRSESNAFAIVGLSIESKGGSKSKR